MSGKDLVLREHPIDGCAERRLRHVLRDIPEEVVGRKVRRDALANLPALHVLPERDDLTRHVRDGDRVLLLVHRVLALCDEKVAVLERHSMHLDEDLGGLQLWDWGFLQGQIVKTVNLKAEAVQPDILLAYDRA